MILESVLKGVYLISNLKKSPNIRPFLTYAHRGAPQLAPENTLAAMAAAKKAGADAIEFDVRLTQDDVPVIFHDANLKRITGLDAYLLETKADQVCKLDAGSWFDSQFINLHIPTLKEWLQSAAELQLSLNIELKVDVKSQAKIIAQLLISHLQQYWPSALPVPLISSTDLMALSYVDQLSKQQLPLAVVSDHLLSNNALLELKHKQFYSVHHWYQNLNAEYIACCHDLGLSILAYTVNDQKSLNALKKMGVDGIFTDNANLYE